MGVNSDEVTFQIPENGRITLDGYSFKTARAARSIWKKMK